MKLTKDDFMIDYDDHGDSINENFCLILSASEKQCEKIRDEILKNQEFVEKCVPIMERLKKRIEELESSKKRPYSEKLEVIIDELQKILEG